MKRIFKVLSIVFVGFLVWYLFLKSSDYTINFKSKALPGTINQSVKLWGKGLKNTLDIHQQDFMNIIQNLSFSDSLNQYHWNIIPINDSLSKVSVGIKDLDLMKSIMNRLKVPFSKTDFTKRSENTVFDFMTVLKDHVDNFKVTIIGEEKTPSKLFAYVSIKKEQYQKAKGMMDNANFISDVLLKNDIKLDGLPMVEVLAWNIQKDSIDYNFGFPVKNMDSLPDLGEIKFKKLTQKKAIKAIFNGNYISSDRAWYQLLEYAKKQDIKLEEKPLEIFHNNPQMGGDSSKWVTEVYMPIDTTVSKN